MAKFGKKKSALRDANSGKNKFNPFEYHVNKTKFQVLGQKLKGDHGRPGVSRSKSIKTREKTLLKEYENRYKAGSFIDKRIGEHNPFLDPEQKIMMRMVAEKRREFSKKKILNLNEEEVLTHKGEALTDATLNDRIASSDEDDDDLFDAKYVKEQHFGGDFLTRKKAKEQEGENKNKSKKEWIEEVIAESKRKKSELKKDKEEQDEAVERLNSQYQNFLKHMAGRRITDEDKEKSTKTCEYKSYDQIVRELLFDRTKRANPTDRLQTEEEIAEAKRDKLQSLEADRKRRMLRPDDEWESSPIVQQSADALDDEIVFKKDKRFHISYKDGIVLKNSSLDESSSSRTNEENSQSVNVPATIKNDAVEKVASNVNELPYTFEVPQDYDAFWDMVCGRSPSEFSLLLERMITCNHPSLGNENKHKCNTLFAYLLQTLHMICSVDPENICDGHNSLEYVDPMIPYLHKLSVLSPPDSASSINQVISEKYEDFQKNGKKFPYADMFIFLKVSGLLFPASDYHHEVMTKVLTILTQFLGECKVKNRREITCLLFTSALLYEYIKRSRGFIGELTNALRGILYLCIPTDLSKMSITWTPPFSRIGSKSELLVLSKKVEKYEPTRLTLARLNEEMELTDEFKVCAVHECLRILNGLTNTWSYLPSARPLFQYVSNLLDKFPIHNYPPETHSLVCELEKQIANLPPHPSHLVKNRGALKTLRMLEPKAEKIVEGFRKKVGTKEFQEQKKLLHKVKMERRGAKRELRKDSSFLANVQLKETLRRDAERKRKVNLIMQGLSSQESDFKKRKSKNKFQ